MKLYELRHGDSFKLTEEDSPTFVYDYTRGVYSTCYKDNGQPVNLPGYTPVLRIGDNNE